VQIERKLLYFTLNENRLGRFMRIRENVGVWRGGVIVPHSGFREFLRAIDQVIQASNSRPPGDRTQPG
jgi:hypothetical protein